MLYILSMVVSGRVVYLGYSGWVADRDRARTFPNAYWAERERVAQRDPAILISGIEAAPVERRCATCYAPLPAGATLTCSDACRAAFAERCYRGQ